MPVPGLPRLSSGEITLYLNDSSGGVNVWNELGNPSQTVVVSIYVANGARVGGVLDWSQLTLGSTVRLYNYGRVQGVGGQGGDGGDGSDGSPSEFRGGGGGGGAGNPKGAGGTATAPATAGSDGTDTAGGAGGVNDPFGSGVVPYTQAPIAGDGGDAINAGAIESYITNGDGEIWGGGGGAIGGYDDAFIVQTPRAGGGPGQDGELGPGEGSGVAGYAIRGSNVTILSGGSSPNIEGTVGT